MRIAEYLQNISQCSVFFWGLLLLLLLTVAFMCFTSELLQFLKKKPQITNNERRKKTHMKLFNGDFSFYFSSNIKFIVIQFLQLFTFNMQVYINIIQNEISIFICYYYCCQSFWYIQLSFDWVMSGVENECGQSDFLREQDLN
eukprot:TRINITY_DN3024_c0_g1_i1.p3 TRINITY_DN3024_c0_g1~~TRINITY_DN3024_c0_g1_i1.p3  ORF type:complete len:143 (-),score=4.21 TRINITY_DN3024_c0_g1_i1:167-595(-)